MESISGFIEPLGQEYRSLRYPNRGIIDSLNKVAIRDQLRSPRILEQRLRYRPAFPRKRSL